MRPETKFFRCRKIALAFSLFCFATACLGADTLSSPLNDSRVTASSPEEHEELRICLLVDQGVSSETVDKLSQAIRDELRKSRIKLLVPWSRPWERKAFTRDGLLSEISRFPLEAPCDRIVALVGRNFGDFLYGLVVGIEVLGSVEQVTHTHGYIVAERASINQIFISPSGVAAHETGHLLGCHDGDSATQCQEKVIRLKDAARQNRKEGKNFFPGQSLDAQMIGERELCDLLLTLQFHQEELQAVAAGAPPDEQAPVHSSVGLNPGI